MPETDKEKQLSEMIYSLVRARGLIEYSIEPVYQVMNGKPILVEINITGLKYEE